jgi:diguanylate cyclase (GGDEF)-like protein
MTREDARRIVQSEAGGRFDPSIVSLLIANLARMEADINTAGLSYQDSGLIRTDEGHNYVEQIKLANREVFSLYELARDFSSSVSLSEILEMFAKKIGEFVPLDTCVVYLLDESGRTATAAHVDGINADELASRHIRVGEGATGYALKMKETVQNVDPGPDFAGSHFDFAGHYSTMASVPLISDDQKLLGALTIYSREMTNYGQENIRLMETISRIASDAIDKSLAHSEVTAHALTDPLTGLPNARSLKIQFEKELARAMRGGSSFQVLMLDLDGFKAVNDSFGHKVGDEMLCRIARVIGEQLRDYDFLARYGGDEFVALIPETTTSVDVFELCSRIEKAVKGFSLNISENKYASVGVSLGASGYPGEGETFDELIDAADRAMYECKKNRKRFALTNNIGRPASGSPGTEVPVIPYTNDTLIVELDETHVIASAAVN